MMGLAVPPLNGIDQSVPCMSAINVDRSGERAIAMFVPSRNTTVVESGVCAAATLATSNNRKIFPIGEV